MTWKQSISNISILTHMALDVAHNINNDELVTICEKLCDEIMPIFVSGDESDPCQ